MEEFLTIGAVAERSGVTTSALRFYEQHGLLSSERTDGNQRRYHREVLRRVAFIRVGQQVGLSLADIRDALASLPDARTPNQRDWERLSARWRGDLDERIRLLQALRDELSSCIGCGCLTLHRCKLYNPNDGAARLGTGPRYLLGNESSEVIG
ncbi:MAG: redox-sensitive transcriptional activator SoxR [Actinobacteria bacterium]|nr:redox-sensitive transcriptional activator SoxR [Actinomycetota bacterium]